MFLLVSLSAYAELKSPLSPDVKEGKSVYLPIRASVNFSKEIHIQQNDQNGSRQGVRQ